MNRLNPKIQFARQPNAIFSSPDAVYASGKNGNIFSAQYVQAFSFCPWCCCN